MKIKELLKMLEKYNDYDHLKVLLEEKIQNVEELEYDINEYKNNEDLLLTDNKVVQDNVREVEFQKKNLEIMLQDYRARCTRVEEENRILKSQIEVNDIVDLTHSLD